MLDFMGNQLCSKRHFIVFVCQNGWHESVCRTVFRVDFGHNQQLSYA